MRPSRLLLFCLVMLIPAAPAAAAVPHTVQPGETLWSIAASNNLTTRTVAAYNGLSEDSQVVLGSTIQIPSTVEGYAALQSAGLVRGRPGRGRSGGGRAGGGAVAPATAPAAPAVQGGYTVRAGDTLSALATRPASRSTRWPR